MLTDRHQCPNCGHNADVPRVLCVCAKCVSWDKTSFTTDGDYIADRIAERDDTPPTPFD